MLKLACFVSLMLWPSVQPSYAAERLGVHQIDRVLSQYRQAAAVQSKVKKTVTQVVLGTSKQSFGEFYFSKGKIRLEITKPDKSTLVFDGKTIWLASSMDGEVVVIKTRTKELKKSDSLITALFDRKGILKTFKLLNKKESSEGTTFAFEPKDKNGTEVTHLEVTIGKRELKKISYTDQRENTVTFEFSQIKKGAVPARLFSYSPPPHAEITELK